MSSNGSYDSWSQYNCKRHRNGVQFWDSAHGGHLLLGRDAVTIIDTPEFQRLRSLAQLGCSRFLYPTAEHTRFPHSLGVGHLAHKVVENLRSWQPELDIRPADCQAAEIAGLCHDLGHGPFSHTWDGELLPRLAGNRSREEVDRLWGHEQMSCKILDRIVDSTGVDLDTTQLNTIKDMILCSTDDWQPLRDNWKGREFMLQIVSNKDTGVDVDKIDYLLRDSRQCSPGYGFDFRPLLDVTRVRGGQLAYHRSNLPKLQNLFHARATMHMEVYTPSSVRQVELMVVDALLLADCELDFMSYVDDLDKYVTLDDGVLRELERVDATKLGKNQKSIAQAQAILRRMRRRDLYPWCAEAVVPHALLQHYSQRAITEQQVVCCQSHEFGVHLSADDIAVQQLKIDFGKKLANPLANVRVYDHEHDSTWRHPHPHELGFMPSHFQERRVRVFLRKDVPAEDRPRWIAAVAAAFTSCVRERLGVDPATVQTNSACGAPCERPAPSTAEPSGPEAFPSTPPGPGSGRQAMLESPLSGPAARRLRYSTSNDEEIHAPVAMMQ